MFWKFNITYSENFACVICHVIAVVPFGTFNDVKHETISDIVQLEFEASGKLASLLKELSQEAKTRDKASYSVHYGAIEHGLP